MGNAARKPKHVVPLDVIQVTPEPAETAQEPAQESWRAQATVVPSMLDLEFSTPEDVEGLGLPSAGFERLTEEEAETFDNIRRAGPPEWVNDL